MTTEKTVAESIVIRADYENSAQTWWDAARTAANTDDSQGASVFRRLDTSRDDGAEVTADEAAAFTAWAAKLPGHDDGPEYARRPYVVAHTESAAAVEIVPVEGHAELHHRYPSQLRAQPAFVWLDCERARLGASSDPEPSGNIPFAVYHSRELRWTIPALKASAANRLLAKIAPIAARVVDGFEARWDGHNSVGRFTEEADEAIAEIAALCDETPDREDVLSVWDAHDLYATIGDHDAVRVALGITGRTTDEELDAIEAREIETAEEADVIEGLSQFLRALRDEESDKIHEPEDADQADDADEESDEADEADAP